MIPGVIAQTQDPFLTVWKTDNPGVSASNQITLPIAVFTGNEYDFWVYWGDGTFDHITAGGDPAATHTYASAGTYTVRIEGKILRGWRFANGGDKDKLLEVKRWGRCFRLGAHLNWYQNFHGCTNLIVTATDAMRLDGVLTLWMCFYGCTSLTDIPNIGKWRINNGYITSLGRMFAYSTNFDADLSDWDTSAIINMQMMFRATKFNNKGSPGINNWNTANVTQIDYLFMDNATFNQPIGNWNTAKVTTIAHTFYNAKAFNQDIGAWNLGACVTFAFAFYGATAFNNGGSPSIDNWDTSKVTNMGFSLFYCTNFNQPIGSWDTSKVTTMGSMFVECFAFNQDIGSWDVGLVTDMNFMLRGQFPSVPTAFDQNLGAWNVVSLTGASALFAYNTLSTANYDNLLVGWNSKVLVPGVAFNGGFSKYTKAPSAAATARTNMVNVQGWTIVDGGPTP